MINIPELPLDPPEIEEIDVCDKCGKEERTSEFGTMRLCDECIDEITSELMDAVFDVARKTGVSEWDIEWAVRNRIIDMC